MCLWSQRAPGHSACWQTECSLGSGFSGPWRIHWAGNLHENRYSGLLLSKTNWIPVWRLLSEIPKTSPAPELSLLLPWIFRQVNRTVGHLNVLYLPWALFKLFDFLAYTIRYGLLSKLLFKKNLKPVDSSSGFSPCFFNDYIWGLRRGWCWEHHVRGHPPDALIITLVEATPPTSWADEGPLGSSVASPESFCSPIISSFSTSNQSASPVSSASEDRQPVCALWVLYIHLIIILSLLSYHTRPLPGLPAASLAPLKSIPTTAA